MVSRDFFETFAKSGKIVPLVFLKKIEPEIYTKIGGMHKSQNSSVVSDLAPQGNHGMQGLSQNPNRKRWWKASNLVPEQQTYLRRVHDLQHLIKEIEKSLETEGLSDAERKRSEAELRSVVERFRHEHAYLREIQDIDDRDAYGNHFRQEELLQNRLPADDLAGSTFDTQQSSSSIESDEDTVDFEDGACADSAGESCSSRRSIARPKDTKEEFVDKASTDEGTSFNIDSMSEFGQDEAELIEAEDLLITLGREQLVTIGKLFEFVMDLDTKPGRELEPSLGLVSMVAAMIIENGQSRGLYTMRWLLKTFLEPFGIGTQLNYRVRLPRSLARHVSGGDEREYKKYQRLEYRVPAAEIDKNGGRSDRSHGAENKDGNRLLDIPMMKDHPIPAAYRKRLDDFSDKLIAALRLNVPEYFSDEHLELTRFDGSRFAVNVNQRISDIVDAEQDHIRNGAQEREPQLLRKLSDVAFMARLRADFLEGGVRSVSTEAIMSRLSLILRKAMRIGECFATLLVHFNLAKSDFLVNPDGSQTTKANLQSPEYDVSTNSMKSNQRVGSNSGDALFFGSNSLFNKLSLERKRAIVKLVLDVERGTYKLEHTIFTLGYIQRRENNIAERLTIDIHGTPSVERLFLGDGHVVNGNVYHLPVTIDGRILTTVEQLKKATETFPSGSFKAVTSRKHKVFPDCTGDSDPFFSKKILQDVLAMLRRGGNDSGHFYVLDNCRNAQNQTANQNVNVPHPLQQENRSKKIFSQGASDSSSMQSGPKSQTMFPVYSTVAEIKKFLPEKKISVTTLKGIASESRKCSKDAAKYRKMLMRFFDSIVPQAELFEFFTRSMRAEEGVGDVQKENAQAFSEGNMMNFSRLYDATQRLYELQTNEGFKLWLAKYSAGLHEECCFDGQGDDDMVDASQECTDNLLRTFENLNLGSTEDRKHRKRSCGASALWPPPKCRRLGIPHKIGSNTKAFFDQVDPTFLASMYEN